MNTPIERMPEQYSSGIPPLAAEEAWHLRKARRLAAPERRVFLVDLGTRLAALADHVERRRTCYDCGRVVDVVDPICDTCGRPLPHPPLTPIHAAQVSRLREIGRTLRSPGGDSTAGGEVDALWERTRTALVELADGAQAPDRNWDRWYRRLLRLLRYL